MMRGINTTKNMIVTGMFAAVLSVMSQIQIPMPSGVPLTLQTFAISLTGFLLGWKRGAITVGVYIMLGAVGLPVFTGFSGGIGKIAGPTGGFLAGFLFLTAACGAGCGKKKNVLTAVLPLFGLLICHLLGVMHFHNLMGRSIVESSMLMSVPYLPKDVVSLAAAYYCAGKIRKRIYIEV